MSEFLYKPPPPKVRHSKEGKARIAAAQRALKISRICKATGLSRHEVEHKLELGLGYCPVHGWKPWPRCLDCKAIKAKKARQKKRKTPAEVVAELRKKAPELGAKVSTGSELSIRKQSTQLDLFPQLSH